MMMFTKTNNNPLKSLQLGIYQPMKVGDKFKVLESFIIKQVIVNHPNEKIMLSINDILTIIKVNENTYIIRSNNFSELILYNTFYYKNKKYLKQI